MGPGMKIWSLSWRKFSAMNLPRTERLKGKLKAREATSRAARSVEKIVQSLHGQLPRDPVHMAVGDRTIATSEAQQQLQEIIRSSCRLEQQAASCGLGSEINSAWAVVLNI